MSWKRAHIWNLALAALLLVAWQSPGSAPGLPAPTEFSGTVGSATSIGLRWRKVEGASGYEIERKVGGGGFSPLIRLPHEVGGSFYQFYTDTGLTPATRYTYRIRAVSDIAQSPWSVSGELETPAAATTRYEVTGFWLGASDPNLYLRTDTGVKYPGATVRVNGVQLNFQNPPGSYYAPSIPGATTGTVLNLEIAVPEGTITGTAAIPPAPTIVTPAADATVPANQPLTVTWEHTGPDPDRFYLHLLGNGLAYVVWNIPGHQRSHTIPADRVVPPSSGRALLELHAVNDGKASFRGPVLDTSEMGVASLSRVVFDIVR
jgi:hypothetical protein